MNPNKIRISIGSAVKLGLKKMKVDVLPTNCHLLTYHPDGCLGNCGFCPQSQFTHHFLSDSKQEQEYLSRVLWPEYELAKITSIFEQKFPRYNSSTSGLQRICVQSLNYENFENDVVSIIQSLKNATSIPISVAIPPVKPKMIRKLKEIGVERICFALDAATRPLFDLVKGEHCNGPYSWEDQLFLLKTSVEVFGRGFVSTHLIIGLGETELEALHLIQEMKSLGILTGLFAFFPIVKTRFEHRSRPDLRTFRKIQLGKYLLDTKKWKLEHLVFDDKGVVLEFPLSHKELRKIISLSAPFETSGCPGCNRPYYTSSPREEQYNYPRSLTSSEQEKIYTTLESFCRGISDD